MIELYQSENRTLNDYEDGYLGYAAYNPVDYELINGIPGNFMQGDFADPLRTAEADLENLGFDATPYNYDGGYFGCCAYTIGHQEIILDETTEQITNNMNGENNNELYRISGNTVRGTENGVLYVRDTAIDSPADSYSELDNSNIPISDLNVLNSDLTENTTDNTRQLVVVSVRGSVTLLDWLMDLLTQFHACCGDFDSGAQMVIESLYGYDDCTELHIIIPKAVSFRSFRVILWEMLLNL